METETRADVHVQARVKRIYQEKAGRDEGRGSGRQQQLSAAAAAPVGIDWKEGGEGSADLLHELVVRGPVKNPSEGLEEPIWALSCRRRLWRRRQEWAGSGDARRER